VDGVTPRWQDWSPGLDRDDRLLGEVLAEAPLYEQGDIPLIVRLLEHPSSPVALPGAVSLVRHDCLHVLLGRGLLPQDEAFVVGFTMGATRSVSRLGLAVFRFFVRWLYPPSFRLSGAHLRVFDLAFQEGLAAGTCRLDEYPLERHLQLPVRELRERVGLRPDALRRAFGRERALLPDTAESVRLPF
jgi:hypothetical protein